MDRTPISTHIILIIGALFMTLPVWVAFATSTHAPETILREGLQFWPGPHLVETYNEVLFVEGGVMKQVTATTMLQNSMILGIGFAIGKVIISMLAAYAIVYFRFRLGVPLFWVIFMTLLLPLEVRIIPSYEVVANMGLLDTQTGLILPLIASATGTFFFRQFFRSVPDELLEAARLDGATAWGFFKDILVPLSRTMIAAILIIMFVVGWNQYLWPLIMTTKEENYTLVIGIKQIYQVLNEGGELPQFQKAFALTILATLPPVLVVLIFQRWFVKGLVESEK
ncbi:glycerol-3-phosphate ABC transporter permease [Roseobacter denitrificans]|uniref:sn-glycerol-3-phosphate transport system permease protein UgpE n=1 Tax=Roseobacter denitrificans (strain ATCC 33942 / OCh 114) TaxID=375451 RepID=Q164Y4_ROSDO|nr:ABC transporter permease subunit [Roseobacter denitrificans]ABG32459.1 glycerol-3-phosphate ABC transporter, permease protein [Roseobacter denitrificans OCh 114]AVL51919.1 glycerol-3-phosphate ABC transporter permease [Roseobacter denitrificans]SFF82080.1 carbohydrate ABC transporter membrane protein 2, CUT1 family [Roseobacter denitrificans OCh 114]